MHGGLDYLLEEEELNISKQNIASAQAVVCHITCCTLSFKEA